MTELINRHIGKITLDATEQENQKSVLRLSKNPIESGANIADHAVLEPKQITIKGKIVAYEPPTQSKMDEYLDLVLPNMPRIKPAYKLTQRALKLKAEIEHAKAVANKYAKVILNKEIDIFKTTKEQLAPFLPSFINQKADKTQSLDRIGDSLNKLYELQRSGELLEVQTGTRLYQNMMITSIEVTTQEDLYADVVLNLEEVFIVETKIANGLSVATKGVRNFGKTQPKKSKSFLKDMF